MSLSWGRGQAGTEGHALHKSFFNLLLKSSPTVAGTSAGQEGGEVTGEGFHLRAGVPAHKQAQRQDPDMQGGHAALSQEGQPVQWRPLSGPPLAPASASTFRVPLFSICRDALER